MSHTVIVGSPVILINQHHIHRHGIANITLERICETEPFRKEINKESRRNIY